MKKNILGALFSFIGIVLSYILLPFEGEGTISWIQVHTDTLSNYILQITHSGSPLTVILIALIIFLIVHIQKDTAEEYIVILSGILTFLLVLGIKEITAIPRPFGGIIEESSYKFPSGHTAGAFYLSLMLFMVFWKKFKKRSSHILYGLILLLYPIGIGLSRIYLGVHTPLDIIAGIFTALFAFYISFLVVPLLTQDQLF